VNKLQEVGELINSVPGCEAKEDGSSNSPGTMPAAGVKGVPSFPGTWRSSHYIITSTVIDFFLFRQEIRFEAERELWVSRERQLQIRAREDLENADLPGFRLSFIERPMPQQFGFQRPVGIPC
jgi:hypothetical protein